MIRINTESQPLDMAFPLPSAIESARRLIVPIQNPETELTPLTQRLWALARAAGATVKLVGLCQDVSQEPYMRRTAVTIASMMNYANVTAEIEILTGKDWGNALRSRCRAGDMIVCWNDGPTGPLRKSFSQLLQLELDVPIYILSRGDSPSNSRSNWIFQVTAWIGFAIIILAFLVLQIRIYQPANEWTITLELLSTAVEFWLIWVWNSKFG